jgi:CRISPR/Cas system endoribonuclease Cas6 (RAMP superfamily)
MNKTKTNKTNKTKKNKKKTRKKKNSYSVSILIEIIEKLQRENRLVFSSAESKAIDRIAKPIKEDEWITVGTLDDEFDLKQVNREIERRGYTR